MSNTKNSQSFSIRRTIILLFHTMVYIFAIIGFTLTGGFFAVRWGLTDVPGTIDPNSAEFNALNQTIDKIEVKETASVPGKVAGISTIPEEQVFEQKNFCKVNIIGEFAPINAWQISQTYKKTQSLPLMAKMIMAVELALRNRSGFNEKLTNCENEITYSTFTKDPLSLTSLPKSSYNAFIWMNDDEWKVIKKAIDKDKKYIDKAAKTADIEPRMIVAVCIVEQLRLYHTQRELFEKVFKPLTVLSTANKMAWGVMAIKESTAIAIEQNLKNPTSPYYLGSGYAHLLDFSTKNVSQERYARLTNTRNHYYSYLYGGLYLKQYIRQWENSGYDIGDRPEILSTLFNNGFDHSHPKAEPKVGGSQINIKGRKYSFGSLAYEFYYSGELTDIFPYK